MENNSAKGGDVSHEKPIPAETIRKLWSRTYNTEGKPDWSHILPYYDSNIHFRDSIQEIHGIEEFTSMTERLAKRSKDLSMNIVNTYRQAAG